MTAAVATFGLLIFLLGMLGVVQPTSLIGFVERPWRSRAGIYLAVGVRVFLGVLLLAAASSTRFPRVVAALGVVSLGAALVIPLLGYARLRRFVEWWVAKPSSFVRAWSVLASAFGAFLVYAAV